ncbi:MAG: phosphatase PAP2 family protein [Saprospiraceae bacterium]
MTASLLPSRFSASVFRYFCLLLLLLTLGGNVAQAQAELQIQPYDASSTTNAILMGLGGTLTGVSIYLDRGVPVQKEEDLVLLEIDKIYPIDRYSTRHFSLRADEMTDKLLLGAFASPFLLLMDDRGRGNFNDLSLIVFEGALINSGLINLSKVLVRRPRPYNYNPDAPLDFKLKKSARYSFFSGHTSTAAYFSMTSAKLFNDLYPDSRARPYVWAGAALVPVLVSYGRMKAGRHFFTDVLVGFVVGSAIAITVPELHK